MCYQSLVLDVDQQAGCLWMVHRELTVLGDPMAAHVNLDLIADRIEVLTQRAPRHRVEVVQWVAAAHRLVIEADSLLFGYQGPLADPEQVAAGLIQVARYRLQQAVWALERADWGQGPAEGALGLSAALQRDMAHSTPAPRSGWPGPGGAQHG